MVNFRNKKGAIAGRWTLSGDLNGGTREEQAKSRNSADAWPRLTIMQCPQEAVSAATALESSISSNSFDSYQFTNNEAQFALDSPYADHRRAK